MAESNLTFPFLSDSRTIELISGSKVMFIMRGLPGSGKTYLTERIKSTYSTSTSCSADDFFIRDDGAYKWSQDELAKAHQSCFDRVLELAQEGKRIIIVDNTHIQRRSLTGYLRVAKANGYISVIVSPETEWKFDLAELKRRNTHGLTLETLQKKLKQYRDVYPIYWGWFFADKPIRERESLTLMAEKYFKACMQRVPEFFDYYTCHAKGPEKPSFLSLFTSPDNPPKAGRVLHCTAFYAGPNGKDDPNVVEYANREIVKKSSGKSFVLTILGIIITPRTVGARVVLTEEQLGLWNMELVQLQEKSVPQFVDSVTKEESDAKTSSKKTKKQRKGERAAMKTSENVTKTAMKTTRLPKTPNAIADDCSLADEGGFEIRDILSSAEFKESSGATSANNALVASQNDTMVPDADIATSTEQLAETSINNPKEEIVEDIEDPSSKVNKSQICGNSKIVAVHDGCKNDQVSNALLLPYGSRSHITLGCAEGVEAVQTGFDLLEMLGCEARKQIVGKPCHADGAFITYYGDGRCTVYFDDGPCFENAVFTGKY